MKKLAVIACVGLVVSACSTTPAAKVSEGPAPVKCLPITEADVKGFFAKWIQSLTSIPGVVALYDSNASLLPTQEDGPYFGTAQITPYFDHFIPKHPVVVSSQEHVSLGCNVAWDIGLYTFHLTENGKRMNVPARFTFIYAPDAKNEWHIMHHHSSAAPKSAARQVPVKH